MPIQKLTGSKFRSSYFRDTSMARKVRIFAQCENFPLYRILHLLSVRMRAARVTVVVPCVCMCVCVSVSVCSFLPPHASKPRNIVRTCSPRHGKNIYNRDFR